MCLLFPGNTHYISIGINTNTRNLRLYSCVFVRRTSLQGRQTHTLCEGPAGSMNLAVCHRFSISVTSLTYLSTSTLELPFRFIALTLCVKAVWTSLRAMPPSRPIHSFSPELSIRAWIARTCSTAFSSDKRSWKHRWMGEDGRRQWE